MTQSRPSVLTVAAIVAVALGVAVLGALWLRSPGQVAHRAQDDASALWESKEPAAYSFDYSYCSGMCAGCRLEVTVRNGEVAGVVERDGQCSAVDLQNAPTIEDIFAMEERDRSDSTTDSFEIHHDPDWGFPSSVSIRCPEGTMDCGIGYQVTGFEVLH